MTAANKSAARAWSPWLAARRSCARGLASGLALAALLLACEAARAERYLEYLHVEAGSGASGGGHAAIRIGETTYHYVYAEPGLIESIAEPNEDFDYAYRALGNRSIHARRIAADAAAYQALADAFERRHVTQRVQLARLDAAERDSALIAQLRARRCAAGAGPAGADGPRVRGAGYFGSDRRSRRSPSASAASGDPTAMLDASAIVGLRGAIERAHGRGALEGRAVATRHQIGSLGLSATPPPEIAEGTIPSYEAGFAERYETLVSASVALDVLLHGRPPLPAAYRVVEEPAIRLTDGERALLRSRAASLRAALVRLAAARRPDWGHPMLVGMARLAALDASLRSGRLVVPDAFDDAGPWVSVEKLLEDEPVVAALLRERSDDHAAARAELFASAPESELVWSRFEVAAAALHELRDAVRRGHGPVRAHPETMLPSRAAVPDPALPLPRADCETLAKWQAAAEAAASAWRERVRELYRYDVIARNCVTEIFRTLDAAGVGLRAGRTPAAGLGFVPFVSAGAVDGSYPVTRRTTLLSYRAHGLARLRETQGRLRTALRESNTLTATLRHADERDDLFLFYTDDATLLRPLYGAINAGVGAGAAVAGLATLPFDRGSLLVRAARSFVFSLPEIAFVNFRKGRNAILPRAWMQPLFEADAAAAAIGRRGPP